MSCNSVSESLYPFVLFPACAVMKPECCILEVKRVRLSNMARAEVILHKNQVSVCVTCQSTTKKHAWVFCLPRFVSGETEA